MALLPDGRILLVGEGGDGDEGDFGLVRLASQGGLDPDFGGGDGKVLAGFGEWEDARSVVLLEDSRFGGGGQMYDNGILRGDFDLALARFLSDGSPYRSFSGEIRRTSGCWISSCSTMVVSLA